MIHVEIWGEKEKGLRLYLRGHAGAAAPGEDPVCAAASILAYTAAQHFSYLYAEGKLEGRPDLRLEKGDAALCAIPQEDYLDEALHGLYVLSLGYALLARQYPQHLKLTAFGNAVEAKGKEVRG